MKTATYTAYTRRRDRGRWIEIGSAHMDAHGVVVIHLNRMLIDPEEFTGNIRLVPVGTAPRE
jgi:hypothetical protein